MEGGLICEPDGRGEHPLLASPRRSLHPIIAAVAANHIDAITWWPPF